MLVQVKALQFWKTEHMQEGCQDAYMLEPSKGLFAVADENGTTLFPPIWAIILVEHFMKAPLMSNDPFEVEWWVRQAQEVYKTRIPVMGHLTNWSVQQKALNQGSASTLAAVRIVDSDPSTAQAQILVFGDSCVIIGNKKTKEIHSFVLENSAQFVQPPICIPSSLASFNRSFHTCKIQRETLGPEHIVIIATDTVSKWILGGGAGRFSSVWDAFQTVYECTSDNWPAFIEECRESKEMVNDDCTALILDLKVDGTDEGFPLGQTPNQFQEVIQQRLAAFESAWQEGNRELVAIYYGDGADLKPLVPYVTMEEINRARTVADALKEVLQAFRQVQRTPGLAAKMQPVWDKYSPFLLGERCAANIQETLLRNGVKVALPPPLSVKSPTAAATSTTPTDNSSQPPLASQPLLEKQPLTAIPQNKEAKTNGENISLDRLKIFFCYAHEDELLLKKLKTHLRPLQRQGHIEMWHDRDISAGAEWEHEISQHLNAAQIILLLVSPDFMASDYCYGIEMKRALERHQRGEARVIPIIVRPVYWQGVLGKLQALPTDAKPVVDRYWHTLDEALYDVAEGIRTVVVQLEEVRLAEQARVAEQEYRAEAER
jgi:hypothetical protein